MYKAFHLSVLFDQLIASWHYCNDVERLIRVEHIIGAVKVASGVDKVATTSVIVRTVDSEDGSDVVCLPNIQFVTRFGRSASVAVTTSVRCLIYH